jgi:TonB family protein
VGAPRVRAWHRAVVSGAAAAALLLTVGAGVFGGARARMLEPVVGEPQQARVGRVRVVERGDEGQRGPAVEEIEQAQEVMVYFEHTAGAPVAITEAKMRQITREQLRRADGEGADSSGDEGSPSFVTLPTVRLANMSGKEVREVGVGFMTGGRTNVVAGYRAPMKPGESQTIFSDWGRRNVIMTGTLGDVRLRVVWVTFADGTQWGARLRNPNAPPSPPHAPDAPNALNAPSAPNPPEPGPRNDVRGVVVSGRGEGVGAGSGVGDVTSAGGVGSGASAAVGEGVGVGRASGGGARVGGLGGQKLYAPEPEYPPIAKAAGAEGTVSVRVTVDEEGNVIAAKAVSGHPLLQSAAVDAARAAKFKPTVVDGKPVRVSGVISYVFTLK